VSSINVVLCNCPPDEALPLARALVEQRLAACVNLVPGVRSVYRWEGCICDEPETTLLIKTASERVEAVREGILALHPYRVPEIVVLRVDGTASHSAYLEWVIAETRPVD
jgi:periplasmic divalent cation tolerance protein